MSEKIAKELVGGGCSVGFATACTNPIDVVKVRMQMVSDGKGVSFSRTGINLIKKEGMGGLIAGLNPAILRAVSYGSLRLGLYEPIKPLFGADGKDAPIARKIAASAFVGSFAAALTNPLDLVKTRLQVSGKSMLQTATTVVRESGIGGLWCGSKYGMLRASVLTSAQLVTYGEVKRVLQYLGGGEMAQVGAGLVTGLVATTAINPFDVLKTRNQAGATSNFVGVLTKEGVGGFMKGWTAGYMRIGPQTALTFLAYEQMRRLLGLKEM